MTRITKLQQLEHDVYQAYSDLDEVFAIAQLLYNYVENDTLPELNKWTVRKTLHALMTLTIEIQCNLEQALEDKTEKKEEDDDGRC